MIFEITHRDFLNHAPWFFRLFGVFFYVTNREVCTVAKKPNIVFDVVAVNTLKGSSAQEYASKIFQEIIEMGVSADRVNISAQTDVNAKVPAVKVFVR